MGAIGIIASIFSGVFGPLVRWAQRKQEMAAAKQAADDAYRLQELKNRDTSAKQEGQNSMQRLKSTGMYFKYITFVMWFYPWVMVQFSQTQALKIFANMKLLPDWYSNSCVILMFAIWGISVGGQVVSTVFSGLGNYLTNKRQDLYNHEQTIATINRQAVMDSFRKDLGGQLDQNTENMINRALNVADDDPSNDVQVALDK